MLTTPLSKHLLMLHKKGGRIDQFHEVQIIILWEQKRNNEQNIYFGHVKTILWHIFTPKLQMIEFYPLQQLNKIRDWMWAKNQNVQILANFVRWNGWLNVNLTLKVAIVIAARINKVANKKKECGFWFYKMNENSISLKSGNLSAVICGERVCVCLCDCVIGVLKRFTGARDGSLAILNIKEHERMCS